MSARPGDAFLVACLTSPVRAAGEVPGVEPAHALEWRADLLGSEDPALARSLVGKPMIFTLRSQTEGGRGPQEPAARARQLRAAAGRFEWIDLEADRDLVPEVLEAVPPERRILSWHGRGGDLPSLRGRLAAMLETEAALYKLVSWIERPVEGLAPLALPATAPEARDRIVAFAAGNAGAWTRLLAPRLGSGWIYAQCQPEPAAAGQFSVAQLVVDYGLPRQAPAERLFGIVGRPALHSLSPRLYNTMYRQLGIEALYLPFEVPVFGDFWLDVVEGRGLREVGFELSGLSVTAPFKEIAAAVAGAASPLVERLGAANTLVRRQGVWEAESTDPEGVMGALAAHALSPFGRKAAVVGAGGAGKAAILALAAEGASVTLVNRSAARGSRVARELGAEYLELGAFRPTDFDLVVNATPLGAARDAGVFGPQAVEADRRAPVVLDMTYSRDRRTGLAAELAIRGVRVIDGREMLLHQAVSQFRLMTGRELDREAAARALGLGPAGAPEGDG